MYSARDIALAYYTLHLNGFKYPDDPRIETWKIEQTSGNVVIKLTGVDMELTLKRPTKRVPPEDYWPKTNSYYERAINGFNTKVYQKCMATRGDRLKLETERKKKIAKYRAQKKKEKQERIDKMSPEEYAHHLLSKRIYESCRAKWGPKYLGKWPEDNPNDAWLALMGRESNYPGTQPSEAELLWAFEKHGCPDALIQEVLESLPFALR